MKTAVKLLSWSLAFACTAAMAADKTPQVDKAVANSQGASSPRADNTSINDRDKTGVTKTPQDQTNQTQDRELLASVRPAIVGDTSLSTMAQNVKVMVEGGAVTLRGPVKNAVEKAKVESLAKSVKGITSADNQLDVRTSAATQ